MNFQNTTERLNNAGKFLKQAGVALIITLVILLFTVLIASSAENINADDYLIIYTVIIIINFILTFLIGWRLVGAG